MRISRKTTRCLLETNCRYEECYMARHMIRILQSELSSAAIISINVIVFYFSHLAAPAAALQREGQGKRGIGRERIDKNL